MATPKWELRIQRIREETGPNKTRTVGNYQVLHDGKQVASLSGMTFETRGPGDNSHKDNNRCVEAGTYQLFTQDGKHYVTIGYKNATSPRTMPKPGLLLLPTGKREGILFHPGVGFLSSVGCINPSKPLKGPQDRIDFIDSKQRVIAVIDDLKKLFGAGFPAKNGKPIKGAVVTIIAAP